MRETFVKTLMEYAEVHPDVCLLTADLGFGVLKPFWEAYPHRFFNVGIAEQNMTAMAAGLALSGKRVVTYSIGNFPTLRCLEQIRNDCAGHGADVKIVCVGGGFTYGSLGMSHHATEDLAVIRAIPGITVFSPGDAAETAWAVRTMLETPGTCYLRLGRGGEQSIPHLSRAFSVGMPVAVREGREAAICFTGPVYEEVARAVEILDTRGIHPAVYAFPTVKPLDRASICRMTGKYRLIVTWEEHSILGGFGSAVAEILAESPGRSRLLRAGIPDRFSPVAGDQRYLRKLFGLDGETVAERIETWLKTERY